jgi:hypothetical protein
MGAGIQQRFNETDFSIRLIGCTRHVPALVSDELRRWDELHSALMNYLHTSVKVVAIERQLPSLGPTAADA